MIDIKNFDDNQCFKWFLKRYLNPADHHPARIRKVDRMFESDLDLKDIKFPIKIRDICKTEKKVLSSLAFLVMKIKRNIRFMCQKRPLKTCWSIIIKRKRQKALSCY